VLCKLLLCKMLTRDRLAGKTKQGATFIVKFGWHISIIKTMFTNNAPSYRRHKSFVQYFKCLIELEI
jgi:hypothetical protein